MVHRGSPGEPVSILTQRISSSTVPKPYGYDPVESSIRQTLLQSSFNSVTAAALSRAATTYLGFCPLLDTITQLPMRERSIVRWRVPRFSQPFGNFCHVTCELVSSRSRAQDIFSFRGLFSSCSVSSSSNEPAPMPFSSRTLTCKQAATHECLDSDALVHTKPRSSRFGN